MSFSSDVVQSLTMLWRNQLISNSRAATTTNVLPLQTQTVLSMNGFNSLILDSNQFEPSNLQTIDIFGAINVPVYGVSRDFWYSPDDGFGSSLIFVGQPGLFDIGFDRLIVTNSNVNVNIDDVSFDVLYWDFTIQSDPKVVHMFGMQHAQVYLQNQGALIVVPSQNLQQNYQIESGSSLLISRLTTNGS